MVKIQIQGLGSLGVLYWNVLAARVEDAYQRHLRAPYLDKSSVKVDPTIVPEVMFIESRLRPMLLQAIPEMLKKVLLQRGTTSVCEILFELTVDAAPGSLEDRRMLQGQLVSTRVATSCRDAVYVLQQWSGHLRRAEELKIEMPDSQVPFYSLKRLVSKLAQRNKEFEHRLQFYLMRHSLPQETTLQAVKDFYEFLWTEVRYHDTSDPLVSGPQLPGQPQTQQAPRANKAGMVTPGAKGCFRCGGDHFVRNCPHPPPEGIGGGAGQGPKQKSQQQQQQPQQPQLQQQMTGKGKEGSKTGRRACHFWSKPGGCQNGASCKFAHDKKDGVCVNCGSTSHWKKDCTGPSVSASAAQAQTPQTLPAAGVARVIADEVRTAKMLYKKVVKGRRLALLDSGATHFVRSVRQDEPLRGNLVELALAIGKTMAYLQGAEILLEDPDVIKLVPLLPLGEKGFDFTLVDNRPELRGPDGQVIHVTVCGSLMYVDYAQVYGLWLTSSVWRDGGNGMEGVKPSLNRLECREQEVNDEIPGVMAMNVATVKGELEHRRRGHFPKDPGCPVCAVASKRRRPHTKLNPSTQAGGELSVDLSGPHVLTYLPGDRAKEERGKYLLVTA
eukprot:3356775-Amphidinium_carterae.2